MGTTSKFGNRKYLWIISILFVILLVISIVILSQKKSARIKADITTVGEVSFSVDDMHTLINSVGIKSIYLKNFKRVEFNPQCLLYNENIMDINGNLIEIKPNGKYPGLKIDGDNLQLVEFKVSKNSRITIYKYIAENIIDLKVQSNQFDGKREGKYYGKILAGDKADFRIEGSRVDKSGKSILYTTDISFQQTFQTRFSSERDIRFASDGQPVFHLVPEISEELSSLSTMFNLAREPLRISEIYFYDNATKISTIETGTIKFWGLDRNNINLDLRDSLSILNRQSLTIDDIKLKENGINIFLSGVINSLRVNQVEQLPSLFEYLFTKNKTLAIFISILCGLLDFIGVFSPILFPLFLSKVRKNKAKKLPGSVAENSNSKARKLPCDKAKKRKRSYSKKGGKE